MMTIIITVFHGVKINMDNETKVHRIVPCLWSVFYVYI